MVEAGAARQNEHVRILVVEDDPMIRHAIAEVLRDLDIFVIEAATADEAWDYLETGGRADLVFTDHEMPGTLKGADLASRVRKAKPELNVVLTSGTAGPAQWNGLLVKKPYPLFETAVRLRRLAREPAQRSKKA